MTLVEGNPVNNFANHEVDGNNLTTVTVATAARYATSTKLPKGLALGIITASGKAAEFDNDASDGTETCVGILNSEIDVVSGDVKVAMFHIGNVNPDMVIWKDADARAAALVDWAAVVPPKIHVGT
jgi:hypothetical protein